MRSEENEREEGPEPARRPYEAPAVVESLPFENVVLAALVECNRGCESEDTGDGIITCP